MRYYAGPTTALLRALGPRLQSPSRIAGQKFAACPRRFAPRRPRPWKPNRQQRSRRVPPTFSGSFTISIVPLTPSFVISLVLSAKPYPAGTARPGRRQQPPQQDANPAARLRGRPSKGRLSSGPSQAKQRLGPGLSSNHMVITVHLAATSALQRERTSRRRAFVVASLETITSATGRIADNERPSCCALRDCLGLSA